jgi:hypothetical protein
VRAATGGRPYGSVAMQRILEANCYFSFTFRNISREIKESSASVIITSENDFDR